MLVWRLWGLDLVRAVQRQDVLDTCWGHAGQLDGAHEPSAVPSPRLGNSTENAAFLSGLPALPRDGWALAAAAKALLGRHQASGSGPA